MRQCLSWRQKSSVPPGATPLRMDDARAVAGEYPLGGHRAINAWSLARAYGDDEPEYIVVGLDGVIEPSRTDFGGSGHRLPAIPIAAIGDRT